ncbi:hypothetical protein LOC54_11460, partial [Acetobacter sp. AN02]|uniref:hypothetical protein n=1 Tax=Acetobacter sp. AN02 TaxID=2894186 RepID=UPI0024346789
PQVSVKTSVESRPSQSEKIFCQQNLAPALSHSILWGDYLCSLGYYIWMTWFITRAALEMKKLQAMLMLFMTEGILTCVLMAGAVIFNVILYKN